MTNIPKVSYLLPTLNRINLTPVLNSIKQHTPVDHEVLIYGPNSCKTIIEKYDTCRYWEDTELNGQVKGYNFLAAQAKGEYLVHMMDDHILLNSINHSIELLESDVFKNRKFKICTMQSGLPCSMPPINTRMGSCLNLPLDLGSHILLRFPVVHRETWEVYLNRYLYHPEFFSHAVDNYLGYFVAFFGEPGIESATVLQQVELASNPKYIVVDCNTCLALMMNLQNGSTKYVDEPNPDLIKYAY